MEIKQNKLGVAVSAILVGLTASILGSGACLQTIPPTPQRDRLSCDVTCSGTYVAYGAMGTVAQGREFRLPFNSGTSSWQSCGTGVTMATAAAFCANTMQANDCLRLGLANQQHALAEATAGVRLTAGRVENLSCSTSSANLTAGGCAMGTNAFCNHQTAAGKPGETPEGQSSWDTGMPAYSSSDQLPAAFGHVMPQEVKLSVNGVEASPLVEGELQLTSACTNCSTYLTGLSLKAAPFMWGVVQVSGLNLHSWDAIPVSIDDKGDFVVDASQHPLAVSLSTAMGLSYGSLPATQIAGHVDTGARTIALDLRGAQVPMEQTTVGFFSVLRATY